MTPDRWAQIKEIFEEAVAQPLIERKSYVRRACRDELDLEVEVLRLLEAFDDTDSSVNRAECQFVPAALPSRTFRDGQVVCDRFQIVRFIAQGGMAEVYEAYDAKLCESIAIKTIHPKIASSHDAVEQFKSEVRRTRRIAGPNICHVYDLFTHSTGTGAGVTFLTMELLHGETLANHISREKRIDPAVAFLLICQMANGLATAHRAGIVHRDFKSSNVILVNGPDESKRAVITDFGLAFRVDGKNTIQSRSEFFEGGGTPAYMAPEQLEGKKVTYSADVYALGVVAYEMITGGLPFERDSPYPAGGLGRNVSRLPRPSFLSDVRVSWEMTILRCLERDPGRRFQSAVEVARALEGKPLAKTERAPYGFRFALAAALTALIAILVFVVTALVHKQHSGPPLNSVAVLPFENVEPGEGRNYYTDGFSEELIHALGRFPELRVVGRDSSFSFKDSARELPQIGRRLGVRGLVTGSISRSAGRLHVSATLVDAADGLQLWASTFDQSETEVFAVQERIAQSVATTLEGKLVHGRELNVMEPIPDLDAHELYLMGRFHWKLRTEDGLRRAAEYFERATEKDPNYAAPLTGLADVYSVLAEWNSAPPAEALMKAKNAATRALKLDSSSSDAYVSLGQVTSLYDRDFHAAEQDFLRALQLDSNNITAHQWYSYMLMKERRFDESKVHALRALALDPISVPANQNLAALYLYLRNDDQMVLQCRKILELEPHHTFAHLLIAQAFARKGLESEAFRELEANPAGVRNDPLGLRTLGEISAILGKRDQAEDAVKSLIAKQKLGGVSSCYIGAIYAMLGNKDQSFAWLERAYNEHDAFLSLLAVYPAYDSLRTDSRYFSLISRLGLR